MIKFTKLLFFIFIMTISLAVFSEDKTITFATLDWAPYIADDIPGQGFTAEIIREAFKRSGYEVKFIFMPWARVVESAVRGQYQSYGPEYYADELKENFLLSEPFPGGPVGLFKRKSDDISFMTLEDLKPYRIGVVRGYVNTPEFDDADYLQKVENVDDITNLRMLLSNRLDLFFADMYVGYYLARENMPDRVDEIEFMSPELGTNELYVCFPKILPESIKHLEAFNKGIKSMKDDGSISDIMNKYGF